MDTAYITAKFAELGFTLVHTGGNSTAYVTKGWVTNQEHLCVTRHDEPEVPESLDDLSALCYYKDNESGEEELMCELSCKDLLRLLTLIKF